MPLNITRYYDYFYKLKEGQRRALSQIIKYERPYLYDYLVRMCGDKERARLITIRALEKLNKSKYHWKSVSELRISLYKSCRKQCLDIWDARTSDLTHPFFSLFKKKFHVKLKSLDANKPLGRKYPRVKHQKFYRLGQTFPALQGLVFLWPQLITPKNQNN